MHKSPACPLRKRLETNDDYLLHDNDLPASQDEEQITIAVATKLDHLAKSLKLHHYNKVGQFTGKLKTISHKDIHPIHIICPDAVVCETVSCKPWSLLMSTKIRDIPLVTLIKGFTVYEKVAVLSVYCETCKTTYYADHECTPSGQPGQYDKVYL